jgi:hypothetical protein
MMNELDWELAINFAKILMVLTTDLGFIQEKSKASPSADWRAEFLMLEKFVLAVTATFSLSLFLETSFLPVSQGSFSTTGQAQSPQVERVARQAQLHQWFLPL